MMSNTLKGLIGLAVASSLTATSSQSYAYEEETNDDDEARFAYGDSCTRLAILPWQALRSMTNWKNAATFSRFCVRELPTECTDYNIYLSDFGELQDSGQNGLCKFLPYAEPDGVPGGLDSYGIDVNKLSHSKGTSRTL